MNNELALLTCRRLCPDEVHHLRGMKKWQLQVHAREGNRKCLGDCPFGELNFFYPVGYSSLAETRVFPLLSYPL